MPTISPRWKVDFARPAAGGDQAYFDLVVVEETGDLVAGGPLAVSVFSVNDRARLWYTVKARVSITGFCATPTALYVQDGPVLSGWNLTEHRCFAAVNLVTEERWEPVDSVDKQFEPPDALYELPEEAAKLQAKLLSRNMLGATSYAEGVHEVPGAARLVFSAPLVRKLQFDGSGGRIFSVSMDGLTVAMTSKLDVSGKLSHEISPLRAEMTMAELPQAGGRSLCYLYYVGWDGSIVALDATAELKRLPAGWSAKGPVVREKVLPLQYHGGLLFGGGVLGADFFVLELDPAAAPRNTTAGEWTRYTVSVEDQMVILSGRSTSRLIVYQKGVSQPDRWRERKFPAPAYDILWKGTGRVGDLSEAKLVVEVDAASPSPSGDPVFRVMLANTVDSQSAPHTPQYPPDTVVLADSTLAGPGVAMPRVAQVLTTPLITQQALYFAGRGEVNGTVKDVLLSYSIGSIASDVAASALQQLVKNRELARAIQVRVMWQNYGTRDAPVPFVNRPVVLTHYDTKTWVHREYRGQTDAGGYMFLDRALAGRNCRVDYATPVPEGFRKMIGASVVDLSIDRVALLQVEFTH
jgi:hypothetical protein